MRIKIVVMSLLIITSSIFSMPRVKSYDLDVTFIPGSASMSGKSVVTFELNTGILDTTHFYLHGELEVDSIKQEDKVLEFQQVKVFYDYEYSMICTRVEFVQPPHSKETPLQIYYHGFMNPSKAASISNYMHIGIDGVFLRSYGYSIWFPIFIEAQDNEYNVDFNKVVIRTPSEFTTVFVGEHLGDTVENGIRNSYWTSENTALTNAQCTSQRFLKRTEGSVIAYYWDDTNSEKTANNILSFTKNMTDLFKKCYNRKAESKQIHIVEMPKYGDISSGNMTGISHAWWVKFDDANHTKRGLSHELVHPFVHIKMNRQDPLYALVREGFPSYFHLPVLEKILGVVWYNDFMKIIEQRYLHKKETGLSRRGWKIPEEKAIDQITAAEIGIYKDEFVLDDRVLLFFNYLRNISGKEKFFEFTRDLFSVDVIDELEFKKYVLKFYPGITEDMEIWLSKTAFPDRFKIENQ